MVVDAINRQRVNVTAAQAQHNQSAIALGNLAVEAEDFRQRDLRHPAPADGRDAGPPKAFQCDRFAVGANDLLDGRTRNCEMLAGDRHRESRDDGQRQRDAQGHARAFAELAVDLDDAADPLDVRPDDVHADTAPRDGGHLVGGGKAGLEDQRELLALGQVRGLGLVDDPGGDRLLDQFLAVHAAAVVVNVDEDLVARLTRRDGENADFALAGLQAIGRKLDAVIDRVADDVGQRIADHLDHLAIELDVAPLDIDQHLLAQLGGEVADHARQADKQILDPLHAGAGNRVAHLGDDRGETLESPVHGNVGR